jgi:FeS assembly SUF system protein
MEELNTNTDNTQSENKENTPATTSSHEEQREVAPQNLSLRDRIVEAIKTVYDPEISVDIYELGLIYDIQIGENNKVDITMTLTSPGCPAAGMLPQEVEEKVQGVEGVGSVHLEVTFDPPWDMSMMSDEARLELGFM